MNPSSGHPSFGLQRGFSASELLIALMLMGVLATLMVPLLKQNSGRDKVLAQVRDAAGELGMAFSRFQENSLASENTTSLQIANQLNYVRIVNNSTISGNRCIGLCTTVEFVPTGGTSFSAGAPDAYPGPAGNPLSVNMLGAPMPNNPSGLGGVPCTFDLATCGGGVGTLNLTLPGGNNLTTTPMTMTPCNTDTPCVVLQNGAVLQYSAWGGGSRFARDAASLDRRRSALLFIIDPDGGGLQPATSLVLFFSGRITTLGVASGDVNNANNALFTNDVLPKGYGFYSPASTPATNNRNTDPTYLASWLGG